MLVWCAGLLGCIEYFPLETKLRIGIFLLHTKTYVIFTFAGPVMLLYSYAP